MFQSFTLAGLWNTGSAPGTEEEARNFLYDHVGDHACVLGGGEWRRKERSWVIGIITDISRALHIPLIGVENYLQNALHIVLGVLMGLIYMPMLYLGLWHLPPLPYDVWAIQDHENFMARRGRQQGAYFMRGVSSAWALKIFSGAIWVPVRWFEAQIVGNIKAILAEHPDTVIQFELPLELAAGTRFPLPRWLRKRIYRAFLNSVIRIIQQLPEGTRIAFHLCWGDLGGHPVVPKHRQDIMAKIDMINIIVGLELWKKWILHGIHEPYGDGDHVPTVTDDQLRLIEKHLFEDLPDQQLPEYLQGVIWALGILNVNGKKPETILLAQRLIRVLLAKGISAFAFAAACGLGRLEVEEAIALCKLGIEVKTDFTLTA